MKTLKNRHLEKGYRGSVSYVDPKKIREKDIITQEIVDASNKIKHKDFLDRLKKHMRSEKARQRYLMVNKPVIKYIKKMRKQTFKDMDKQNPNYKPFNIYRFSYFRNHVLMRSPEGITAGVAWSLLKKNWNGFKVSYGMGNEQGMVYYGKGVQKYLYMLEELPIDFSNIGLKPYKEF